MNKRKRLDLGDLSEQGPPKEPRVEDKSASSSSNSSAGGSSSNESKTNPLTMKPYSANYFKILETRKNLPVYAQKDEFAQKLRSNQVLILVGETGSGKTTQVRFVLSVLAR